MKQILDSKLQILFEKIKDKPEISITYFVPDTKKDGGEYITVSGIVRKINSFSQSIILIDNTVIPISEIIDISGDIFNIFD